MGRTKSKANGEGSVFRHGRKWRWQLEVEGEAKRLGRVCLTKTEASAELLSARTEAAERKALRERGEKVQKLVPLRQAAVKWMKSKDNLKPKTRSGYQQMLDLYLLEQLGDVMLHELKPSRLREHYLSLYTKGLAHSTVRHAHVVLRGITRQALVDEVIDRDPLEHVVPTPPRDHAAELERAKLNLGRDTFHPDQAWTRAEVEQFNRVATNDRDGQILSFMLLTGLRRGEACGLHWEFVDLDNARLKVVQHLVAVDGVPILETPKTRRSRREIPLLPEAVALLRRWKVWQAQEKAEVLASKRRVWQTTGEGFVFTAPNGRYEHPDGLRKDLGRIAAVAGVRRIRIHELRDTYATMLALRKVPIEVISRLLGHTSAAFTLDRYRQVLPDEVDGYVLNIGDLLGPQREPEQ